MKIEYYLTVYQFKNRTVECNGPGTWKKGLSTEAGHPIPPQVHCLLSIPLPFTLLDINKVYFFTTLALVTYLDDPRSNPCTLLHDFDPSPGNHRATVGDPSHRDSRLGLCATTALLLCYLQSCTPVRLHSMTPSVGQTWV